MTNLDSPRQNHLLGALPVADYERIFPHLERVSMFLGKVLYEPGDTLSYAYFPTSCIVSKFYVMENGASTEIAVIGNDGTIGIALFMGDGSMPNRAVVRSTGFAFRLRRQLFMQEFNYHGTLLQVLLRYTQTLLTQMAQSAACNRHHSIDQQLCRWLLLSLDRLSSNELDVTHEIIASMLGVSRESVTAAAKNLQRAELIDYHHGHISVLNRPGLEERVCECYQVVKKEADRLGFYVY